MITMRVLARWAWADLLVRAADAVTGEIARASGLRMLDYDRYSRGARTTREALPLASRRLHPRSPGSGEKFRSPCCRSATGSAVPRHSYRCFTNKGDLLHS